MKLQKYNKELDIFNDFRSMFSDLFDTDKNTFYRGAFSPATDVVETDLEYQIHIDIPGMNEKDFNIKFEGGSLIVQGEKVSENKTSNNKFTRLERQFGKFSRSWRLPDNVDSDKTEAAYEKGTLTIKIPKKEQEKPKTVEVKLIGK